VVEEKTMCKDPEHHPSGNRDFWSFFQFSSSNQSMDAILNIPGQLIHAIMLPAYKGKELLDHQNVDFNYHLAQSQVRIEHAIGILKGQFSSLHELRTQIRNHYEMKDSIQWIISCVVLHNLLEHLKDQWNGLYEEEELDSAPVVKDNIDNSNNGIHDILHTITLSHFEEPQ
ncbi:hypothetical protein VP01_8537g1, partial [Puccinia sorghi]